MYFRIFGACLLQLAWLPCCLSLPQSTSAGSSCKALPNTPSWPSKAQWNALNSSLSGQLLAPLPPAAVCDPSLAVFNNASCAYVASQWDFTDFHANDPVSVDWTNWENDACLPVLGSHCNLQQFPAYVVDATEAIHVKLAVNFARRQNVRLIVKGTGHDFLGRWASVEYLNTISKTDWSWSSKIHRPELSFNLDAQSPRNTIQW